MDKLKSAPPSANHGSEVGWICRIRLEGGRVSVRSEFILGIDPGVSGAIVLLDGERNPVEWMRMPVIKEGKASRVNAAALGKFVGMWIPSSITAYVESVHSMPGQGVTSCFNFGHSAGVIAGVLAALEIPTVIVTPQRWKKRACLIGKGKDESRSMAIRRWPKWRDLDKIGAGQAYADAAFIALYGED